MLITRNFIDEEYVAQTRQLLEEKGEEVVFAARIDFAEQRIVGFELALARLSALHSFVRAEAVLNRLHDDPALIMAIKLNGLDPDKLEQLARERVLELKTTRPNRCHRAAGAGRPATLVNMTVDMFEFEVVGVANE